MAYHFVTNFTRSVKQIKNHISQCKIAKNLGLSPSTIHNIVKRFREFREITVHVGQVRKPQLNVLELWALRWHCIRDRHAAVLNIATWAQEYFRKLLSITTVCCCIKKCNLNICYSRRKLYINSMQRCRWILWAGAHLRCSKRQWKCVLYSDESTFQLVSGKNGFRVLSPKVQRDHPDFHYRQKQKQTSVMVWGCSRANSMGGICAKVPLTWRHTLGLYRDIYCHQDDGKSMVIISRQCQVSFCMCYNSVVS